MRTIFIIAILLSLAGCAGFVDPETGKVTEEGRERVEGAVETLNCLPKGLYLAEVVKPDFRYTEAQKALIDLNRIANCDPLPAGYAPGE